MVWTYDTIIGEHAAWGDWRAFPDMTPEAENILSEVSRIIKRRLERYGTNENNFGLIHADLRLANLLIEGDQIKVIDFDDCGFGWHLHDLASALSFIEDKPIVPKLVNAFVFFSPIIASSLIVVHDLLSRRFLMCLAERYLRLFG